MDILNLDELRYLDGHGNQYDYKIIAECKERPTNCIKCFGEHLIKHETKKRTISDVTIHGKRTKIELFHVRYKCKGCGYTFFELLDCVDTDSRCTKRLVKQLQQEALTRPFLEVGEAYGVSNMTVRRAFDKYVAEKDSKRLLGVKAPRVIGIDEAHLNKQMRGVITDIEHNRLIEVLPTNTKKAIKEFISSLDGYKDIEVATMDMASGYRYGMRELVPDVLCVIDKFHVVQYAQMALDRVRIDYKNSLSKSDRADFHKDKWLLQSNKEDLSYGYIEKRDILLEKHEPLMTAYWYKEMVRDLYNCEDKKQAYEWYYQLEKSVPKNMKPFKELMRTYNKVKPEIFNYFDAPYTNAYTESVNNLIKRVEKDSNGYSFDVLRAKVLYGTQQPKKPKYGACGFNKLTTNEIVE